MVFSQPGGAFIQCDGYVSGEALGGDRIDSTGIPNGLVAIRWDRVDVVAGIVGEVGAVDVTPQNRLNVSATNLPRDMTVAVLQMSS